MSCLGSEMPKVNKCPYQATNIQTCTASAIKKFDFQPETLKSYRHSKPIVKDMFQLHSENILLPRGNQDKILADENF